MELRDLVATLRKGWVFIVALTAIGVACGIGLVLISPKIYTSSVQLFVAATSTDTSTASNLAAGNTFAQDRVQSYVQVANSPKVTAEALADPTVKALGLDLTATQLADEVNATAAKDTVLIDLQVSNKDPRAAAVLAQAVASAFRTFVQNTETVGTVATPTPTPSPSTSASASPAPVAAPAVSPVKLTITRDASIPGTPASPNKFLDIAIGTLLGLVVGVALVFVRGALDNTVKSPADFEGLGVPVLGFVPLDKRASRSPVAFRGDPHSARSESYRAIRTNMQFVDVDNPPRLIAVTSAMPGEGKSTTSINIAAALAEAGYRVCLVDADLRRPSIARTLGLVGDVGFTTVVIGETPVEDVLQNAGRNLAVLTSGPVPPNPSELLLSAHARQVILQLAERVDFVVIDTPPLLPVTDAAELATIVDATLVVARYGKTTREQSARAVAALAKVGLKPVGVILNMVSQARGTSDYEYGYYYAPYRPDRTRRHEDKAERKAARAAKRDAAPTADTAAAEDATTSDATTTSGGATADGGGDVEAVGAGGDEVAVGDGQHAADGSSAGSSADTDAVAGDGVPTRGAGAHGVRTAEGVGSGSTAG